MRVGIMQPYFFPYIGYFQLIHSVDTYVNLDHVNFMKRSYMTRNIVKNDVPLTVQVQKGSQNSRCKDVQVDYSHDYINKFYKKIDNLYSKSPNYKVIMEEIILPSITQKDSSISDFNFSAIKKICKYLEIKTNLIDTSENLCKKESKKELGLKEITNNLGGRIYINAIGGTKLYNKEYFQKEGIDLFFLQSGEINLKNPNYSILHHLFESPKDLIQKELENYKLI